jgi:hypothetical protein
MDSAPYVFELARMHRAHPRSSPEKLLVTYEDYAIYSKIWRDDLPQKTRDAIMKKVNSYNNN